MSYYTMLGFFGSMWLFREYSSLDINNQNQYKDQSYVTLEQEMIPAIQEGNSDLLR